VSGRPPWFWSLAGLKTALVLLLLLPAINPGWEQYDDKGMHWRMLAFALAGLLIPALHRATGATAPYPYLADALLITVPLTDVIWNTFHAYDRVWWWDDLTHLLNSIVIATVIGLWLRQHPLGSAVRFLLVARPRDDPRGRLGAGGVSDLREQLARARYRLPGHARRPGTGVARLRRRRRLRRAPATGESKPRGCTGAPEAALARACP
jgi:hypothetical protein